MEKENKKGKLLDLVFKIGVIGKGIDGFLELIGGFIFLLVSSDAINRMVIWLTRRELIEDPGDLVSNSLIQFARYFSINAKIFGAVYLFTHGAIKIILVLSLLRRKLWAYPTAIAVFSVFVIYQIYRYIYAPSVVLILLSALDAVIILLTWREYKRLKSGKI